ncbi:hypothetical protein K402DRAFT_103643 [Aulographum hederae CBS 113979]|uniref:Uncharacterized protein n=1 Tax=Aulographum hederae CBS 113979 TaxID=1176131 RepID=A0A6G1GX85_9PEZI|nr:hypothetical protein K402DRAFT_103643 [Aulographum hederae CBS 113979]
MPDQDGVNPDTAPRDRSIWNSIGRAGRATLENEAKYLKQKEHVAGRQSYGLCPKQKDDHFYSLPFDLERDLADDFAFIAAFQPGPLFISAATLEEDRSGPNRLKLRLAANEGIPVNVKKAFDSIFEVLWKSAKKEISKEECQTQLLGLIVQLNCNKILYRLGSAKYRRAQHCPFHRDPLPQRLRGLYRDNIQAVTKLRDRSDADKLDSQIGSFEAVFVQLEKGGSAELLLPNLEAAVKQAFDLTIDGTQLVDRLKKLRCSTSTLERREVQDITKVARYWRVSRHLAICSKDYRPLFENAKWCSIPKYKPSTSTTVGKQFVHAEIQLLVHYELKPCNPVPRAIGASKDACFLCDAFIQAHGRFYITGAHRQAFHQWTVPDLKEYNKQTVSRFRGILAKVRTRVNEEYRKAQAGLPNRPVPAQSTTNLNICQLTTPSASTVVSLEESHRSDQRVTVISHSSSSSTLRQVEQLRTIPESEVERGAAEEFTSPLSSIKEEELHDSSDGEARVIDTPVEIIQDEAFSSLHNWVYFYPSFSSSLKSSGAHEAASQSRKFSGASLAIDTPADDDIQRLINVADIPMEEELLVEMGPNDTVGDLSFLLLGSLGQKIRMRCRWHE